MASNFINQPTNATTELNAITKICKYRGLHEGHLFISRAMEVRDTPGCDMDCLIKECVRLFHDRQLGGHLSLSFCIEFLRQCVSITLQCVLAFVIKKNIT
jgi:hypothetical protein